MIVVIDIPQADGNGAIETKDQQPLDDIGNRPAWEYIEVPQLHTVKCSEEISSTTALDGGTGVLSCQDAIMYVYTHTHPITHVITHTHTYTLHTRIHTHTHTHTYTGKGHAKQTQY